MVRDEDGGTAGPAVVDLPGSPEQRHDDSHGGGGDGASAAAAAAAAAAAGGAGGGGVMKSAPAESPGPAQRLAHAHSVIEHLQQNLATQLKPSTVEALRSAAAPHRNGHAAGAPSDDRRADSGPAGETADAPSAPDPSAPSPNAEAIAEPPARTRVSWTTRLLERLSQEEKRKKDAAAQRAEQQQQVQLRAGRRLARYPGQKDYVPTRLSAPPPPKPPQPPPPPAAENESNEAPDGPAPASASANPQAAVRKSAPPAAPARVASPAASPRGDAPDGYAQLISELTSGGEDSPRPEAQPARRASAPAAPPHAARRAPTGAYEGRTPASPTSPTSPTSPRSPSSPASSVVAVSSGGGGPAPRRPQGDYFVHGRAFVEANANPVYAEPPAVLRRQHQHQQQPPPQSRVRSPALSLVAEPRAMSASPRPRALAKDSSFDEDSDHYESPSPPRRRPAAAGGGAGVDIPGYAPLRLRSPTRADGHSGSGGKGSQRSPAPEGVGVGVGGGRPRSASPRSARKAPAHRAPTGLRRLLSPSSLFSSASASSSSSAARQRERDREREREREKEREPERRPLLGSARVAPAQRSPVLETAFLSDASPTKQNQANLSRRSKSVSPGRERALHQHHPHQLHHPQPLRPVQLQAPSPTPPTPPPHQHQPYQHQPYHNQPHHHQQLQHQQQQPHQHQPHQHQLLLMQQTSPLRVSPRQASTPQSSPSQASSQASPPQASPRPASLSVLQGSPRLHASPREQASPKLQAASPAGESPRALEERLQQLRRELSPAGAGAGAGASARGPAGASPGAAEAALRDARDGGDGPAGPGQGAAALFVRSRRDVRYASLPARYARPARPASAPLHLPLQLHQPIYENVQPRYVAPVVLDLERHAISGSPDIRMQLQQQKRHLLLHQRHQQQQLLQLQQQGHLLPGRDGPYAVPAAAALEPTYGRAGMAAPPPSPASPSSGPARAPPAQHHHQHQQHHQQRPARAASVETVQLRHKPIFKRGSLVAPPAAPSPSSEAGAAAPKRVSFTGGEQRPGAGAWPTRNGPAPQPPTRQHLEPSPAPLRPLLHLPPHLHYHSESESGSEAGEVQRILMRHRPEEEWGADGKARGPPGSDHGGAPAGGREDELRRSGGGGARAGRRDEPRRHTLSGDHHHHPQPGSLARSMDLESPLPRGYPPPSTAMLFDDDPGIMSEVETSSTGFRRGGKQRSSLPVVRTPSKTLERPLGLVFLQYRSETKRALLPNEITSIDTVKALFVRSFPKQLTMEYLDSPHVKIYIHDSSKDMFYELEDVRSHLRDIRDRSVLRLFESADMNGGVLPGAGVGVMAPSMWDQDQSYFSEPEFDSEYQHQHIHKSKTSSKGGGGSMGQQPYYMTHSYPPGGATPGSAPATLPRGGPLLRAYSPAVVPPVPADRIKTLPQSGVQPPPKPVRMYQQVKGPLNLGPRVPERTYASFSSPSHGRAANIYSSPDRLHSESGYMSSPERGGPRAYPAPYTSGAPGYEDPYYSQYASRSGSITPVIDEEASDTELMDEQYSLYGVKLRPLAPQPPRGQFPAPQPYDATRLRVENMERQLANLTGLVQKALTQTPTPREYLQVPPASRDANYRNDKSVSFEKSVSFSDEPPDMNSPKQHSPQHTERTERDRHKPAPPPKPVSLSPGQYEGRHVYRDLHLTPEMYNQLRGLQKKAKDLRQEVRNLRRMSQAQAHTVRETIRDTFIKIRTMLLLGGEEAWAAGGDAEKLRLSREEDAYKQEMLRLEKDLTELESTVEELRGNVINRKTRVNMSDVENMALILSKSSKTVADLKVRFPSLQEGMKSLLSSEMEKVVREEKFLKEEPERLESALRRCKKLTGTLVTLKRLASVQEQRLPTSTPDSRLSPTLGTDSDPPITPPAHGKAGKLAKHYTRGSKVK